MVRGVVQQQNEILERVVIRLAGTWPRSRERNERVLLTHQMRFVGVGVGVKAAGGRRQVGVPSEGEVKRSTKVAPLQRGPPPVGLTLVSFANCVQRQGNERRGETKGNQEQGVKDRRAGRYTAIGRLGGLALS